MKGFSRSLAFLIAIDRYANVPELRTPVSDAEELATVLRRDHGFTAEVIANEQATLAGLQALLAGLTERVGHDDRVIFYFAGHGIALESDGGPKGFILAQDAERNSDTNYLSMVELHDALSALPCRHMLVILDCCFAGAFRWSSFRHAVPAAGNLHKERFDWFIHDAAWQAIASAAHDQKALDVAGEQPLGKRDDERGHSPFADILIRGLKGKADMAPAGGSGDGVITATERYLFLEQELLPKGDGGLRQTPIFWPLKKHDKGQFVFLVPGRELALPDAPRLDADANPWRGLEPYETRHAELFFGRGEVSRKLVERVVDERLVVVTGPSGIGKSSLVRAGLLSRLKNVPSFKDNPPETVVVRPGPTPFASLARALGSAIADEAALQSNPHAVAMWVKSRPGQGEVLLVIDQAEELITMSRDDVAARSFLTLIDHALAEGEGRLRVVITVRSEFEPQFSQLPLKERWPKARFLVPPMTQDELRRVIEGPAAVKVMRFEPGELVDGLVNEVVQMPGALPLLSFALSQMYANYMKRRGDDRALTAADYEALEGGVTGSLRVRANQVVDEGDELTARCVLERFVSIEAGEFARRRVHSREFKVDDAETQGRIDRLLRRMDGERLVVTDATTAGLAGGAYYELAHDALILGWDRLVRWVREDAELIIALRRLTPDAEEWATGKDAGLLWDDSARIVLVNQLQARPTPGLNGSERKFAKASLHRSKRNQAIRWGTAVALVLLTIGASIAAYLANSQRLQAIANLKAAEARELTLSAEANIEKDPQLSLILSIAAARKELASGQQLSPRTGSLLRRAVLATPPQIGRSESGLETMTWSPDGKHIATGSQDGTLEVINVESGKSEHKKSGHGWIDNAAWSSDGKFLAYGDRDGILSVWDSATGNTTSTKFGSAGIASVSWQAGKPVIAIGVAKGEESRIVAYDLDGKREIFSVPGFTAAWSPDGKFLAVSGFDNMLRIHTGDGKTMLMSERYDWRISAMDWAPDGKRLAMASVDDKVMIYDVARRARQLDLEHGFSLCVKWSPDGNLLVSGSGNDLITIWDTAAFEPLFSIVPSENISGRAIKSTVAQGYVLGVDWKPDGTMFAASNRGGGTDSQGFVHLYLTAMVRARTSADWLAVAEQQVTRTLTATECRQYTPDECAAVPSVIR